MICCTRSSSDIHAGTELRFREGEREIPPKSEEKLQIYDFAHRGIYLQSTGCQP